MTKILASLMLIVLVLAGCTAQETALGTSSDATADQTMAAVTRMAARDRSPQATHLAPATSPVSQDYQAAWRMGLVAGGSGLCYAFGPAFEGKGFVPEGDGIWFDAFRVDPRTIGSIFRAELSPVSLEKHSIREPMGFTFFDDAGKSVWVGTAKPATAFGGVVPGGAALGVFWSCVSGPMEGEYHAGGSAASGRHVTQVYETDWFTGVRGPQCYSSLPDPCCNGELREYLELAGDGIHFDRFDVDEDTWGLPLRALVRSPAPMLEGVGLTFYDQDGKILRSGGIRYAGAGNQGVIESSVPRGSSTAVFWSCASGPVRASYQAGPFYETSRWSRQTNAATGVGFGCPQQAGAGVIVPATQHAWEIPATLRDGRNATVNRIAIRLSGVATVDGYVVLRDVKGAVVDAGPAPLIVQRILTPGDYKVTAQPCTASHGEYWIFATADLVPASKV
jgi:hypothetical protein